ncbi:hypothetical protein Fmac_001622 [Flemingia macrophylla]|uniref:Uncharacterized protein n=1 Tax=Flemingia macrophylla TaxID=520843 RepID=A0ABD1NHL4_9FABA
MSSFDVCKFPLACSLFKLASIGQVSGDLPPWSIILESFPGLSLLGIKYYLGSLFRLSLTREKEVLFRKPLQALPNSLGNRLGFAYENKGSLFRLSLTPLGNRDKAGVCKGSSDLARPNTPWLLIFIVDEGVMTGQGNLLHEEHDGSALDRMKIKVMALLAICPAFSISLSPSYSPRPDLIHPSLHVSCPLTPYPLTSAKSEPPLTETLRATPRATATATSETKHKPLSPSRLLTPYAVATSTREPPQQPPSRATSRATPTATSVTSLTSAPSPLVDREADRRRRRDDHHDRPFTYPLTCPPSGVSPSLIIPLEKIINLSTLRLEKTLNHCRDPNISRGGQCGYDIEKVKASDVLLDLAAPTNEKSNTDRHPNYRVYNIGDERFLVDPNDSLIDRRSESTSLSSNGDLSDNLWSVGSFDRIYKVRYSSKVLESLFNIPKSTEHDKDTMNWRNVVKQIQTLGPGFNPSQRVAESKQRTYAKGDEYHVFREDSQEDWDSMKSYYRNAATAYTKGDRAYALHIFLEQALTVLTGQRPPRCPHYRDPVSRCPKSAETHVPSGLLDLRSQLSP